VCGPGKRRPAPRNRAARSSAARIEASSRAVALSRARVSRDRQPRWDEHLIEQATIRLGFQVETCRVCTPGDDGETIPREPVDGACPACDGEREVFRRGGTTVSRARLLTLSMWPS
jgi:hypothetical protein